MSKKLLNDEEEDTDVETYPVPDGSEIKDAHLREAWDEAVRELDGERASADSPRAP